ELITGATLVNENDPPFINTVYRNGSFNQALAVTITNNRPDKLAVTNLLVIPAGWDFAQFTARPMTNGIVDGDQIVTPSVSASNYLSGSATVTVHDIDVPSLSLSLSAATISKGQSVTGMVQRSVSSTQNLAVALSSSSPLHLAAPSSVIIPSNQLSATFIA